MEAQKIFIIDGMSLLFRSFYAMGSRLTAPDGTPVGAVYGFLKIIFKILKEQKPTHFVVCWDLKQKTFRHDFFPLYKSNRGETPPDIIPQIALIKELMTEFHIPSIAIPGFEADDIACSIAKLFEKKATSYLVTADKDYMQVVSDSIFLFSLKKGDDYDVINREKVIDYFGVPPEKVTDVLALTGDAVDFIPGVKGIGDKTAAKLILEYGSLEGVYENISQILNKRAQSALAEQKENAFLSKYLATVKCDIEIPLSEEQLKFTFEKLEQNTAVRDKLSTLKMFSLLKSFASPEKTLKQASQWKERKYSLIKSKEDVDFILDKITSPQTPFFALDTETTGLDALEDKPVGISFCFEENCAFYLPCHPQYFHVPLSFHDEVVTLSFDLQSTLHALDSALQQRSATVIAHNLKYDFHQLLNIGINLGDAPFACTMVGSWLLNPSEPGGFSLDALSLKVLGLEKIPTSALIGKAVGRQSMLEVPLTDIVTYGCEDADATFQLWTHVKEKLDHNSELLDLFYNMEMPILRLLVKMERQGVKINSDYLDDLAHQMQLNLNYLESEIHKASGSEFKITSPKQLGDVLFDVVKVHEVLGFKGKLAKTTLGYKTDAKVLEQFEAHPIVQMVQHHRELSKLLNTYVAVLPNLVKNSTQKIHTSFNQIGTATGRLSSSDPNLQNIPIRTEWGKKVRAAIVSSLPDGQITSADYSQIELRVLAHLSQDKNMLLAFQEGQDIHRQTAAQILGKSLQEVSNEERSNAKAINFGIIYGMGPHRLANEQKISMSQAKMFIEKYFLNFSGVREYLDNQRLQAHEVGIVKTFFGRIRPILALKSNNFQEAKLAENMAINAPIQGTAADIMKKGMLAVQKRLEEKNLKTKMIIQVHDELVLDGPKNEETEVRQILKEAMENAVKFDVPMLVEVGVGQNWFEAK